MARQLFTGVFFAASLILSSPTQAQVLVSIPVVKKGIKANPASLEKKIGEKLDQANVLLIPASETTLENLKKCRNKVSCLLGVARKAEAEYLVHTIIGKRKGQTMCQLALLSINQEKPLESVRFKGGPNDSLAMIVLAATEKLIPLLTKRGIVKPAPVASVDPQPGLQKEPRVKGAVMVLGIRAVGVDASSADVLTHQIGTILGARPELKTITKAEVQEVLALERDKQLMGCDADQACLAQIRDASNADFVLSGSLGIIGGSSVITLSLVRTESTETVGQVNLTRDKLAQLSEDLPGAIAQLFGWKSAVETPRFKLPKGQETTFAVLDLKASGVKKEIAANLTQILSAEIKRVDGTKVIGREDLLAILSTEKLAQMLGADCDTSCMAELGGALGADKLITGHVGKVGDKFVISLRLIDPATVVVNSRSTESYEGEEKLLIRATRAAARNLIGVSSDTKGALIVSVSQNEAEIFLDGKKVGVHPLPPIPDIVAGKHRLRIRRDGFYEWRSDTYVDSGEDTAMWAQLMPMPERWYEKWWVWTLVGVAAAGGGTAAVLASQGPPTTGNGKVIAGGP